MKRRIRQENIGCDTKMVTCNNDICLTIYGLLSNMQTMYLHY